MVEFLLETTIHVCHVSSRNSEDAAMQSTTEKVTVERNNKDEFIILSGASVVLNGYVFPARLRLIRTAGRKV
jgi:hypothetical protein